MRDPVSIPAMTPQQRRFATSGLKTYREVIVGNGHWGYFVAFELYNLLLGGMASVVGLGLRRAVLPLFFRRVGRGLVIGRGVTLRAPNYISLGRNVVIDDYALVDVRPVQDASKEVGMKIGDCVYIGRSSIVSAKHGKVILGSGCNIGSNCRVATQGTIEIGESVLIAAYVYIGGGSHRFGDLSQPIMEQGMDLRGGVRIGSNSWIGTRSTIVDGVTIGSDAVVGAHSLVLDDVPDRAIVAGTPARIVRYREDVENRS